MKKVSIVGFGRFGAVLYRLLKDDFDVTVYKRGAMGEEIPGRHAASIAEIYESDVIFYAVPIESFESVIAEHRPYFTERHLLIDVLSVKMHPATVFKKYLKGTGAAAMLTHPMFGPDSTKHGFEGLPIIVDRFTADERKYEAWKDFFTKKQLRVVEMQAREHDKIASDSQGLTHFIGRLLEEYGLEPSVIDSLGTRKLLEVKAQTCNDTWQLFTNLQHYNPYTAKMRIKLGDTYDDFYNRLLPKQVDPDRLTYGIQGGIGSFNEEAVNYYLERSKAVPHTIKYLHTTENVLRELHAGNIDRGQFAIHNSVGGVVDESIQAMAAHKFKIVDQFGIKISHALMIRPDAEFSDITTIMSHPQVFAQCGENLAQKYPHLAQVSGKGEHIDHAMVAKDLSEKKLPKHIATMGSSILGKIYGLTIIEDNLQDAKDNFTSFLIVSRPH